MIFYYIHSSKNGYFCGYHLKWTGWWIRPCSVFIWDAIPNHLDEVTIFIDKEKAQRYLNAHYNDFPEDCDVQELDLDFIMDDELVNS